MPRLVAWFVLLVAMLPLGQAVAGPPEAVFGKLLFDDVAYWLRRYDRETNRDKRLLWLEQLARRRDARVEPVFRKAMTMELDDYYRNRAQCIFAEHYLGVKNRTGAGDDESRTQQRKHLLRAARVWLDEQEIAELQRRLAAQRPR
jgi:hypothetical protein